MRRLFSSTFNFASIFALSLAVSMLGAALVLPVTADAQTLPDISTWKTVTSKEVGVSLLMPSGTVAANAGLPNEAKKGRLIGVIFDGPDSGDERTYGAVILRADETALAGLRAMARAAGAPEALLKKAPIELLYEEQFKPLINDASVDSDPRRVSVVRRPLLWHRMNGEEITVSKRATKDGPASRTYLRLIKNENSIYLLSASEKNPTSASAVRARRFFDSLTITPGGPFAKKINKTISQREPQAIKASQRIRTGE